MKQITQKTIRFYLKHAFAHPWQLSAIFIGLFLGVGTDLIFPFMYKQIIDGMTGAGDLDQLIGLVFILLWLGIVHWVGWRVISYCVCHFEPNCMTSIMNECFDVIHSHSYNFFNNNFVGGFVKKVNRTARSFEDISDSIFFNFTPLGLKIIASTAVLFYLKPLLGVAVFIWIVFFLVLNYILALYKLPRYDIPKAAADTSVTARLADTFLNNSNVKLFAAMSHERREFRKITDLWRTRTVRSWLMNQHVEMVQGITMVAIEFLIMYYAVIFWSQKFLTVGDIALIQGYLFLLFHNIWDFGRNIRNLYERFADAAEMTEILETPVEIKDAPSARKIKITRGQIDFEKVSFAYTGDTESDVIKNLTFKIKPSEKIALIGPSGGGKSTIVKLILRLFDIDKGSVKIDSQEISKCTQDSLRSQIALVPQDPILFHRSLLENIRYGRRDASDKEVLAASRLAYCHEFISTFPQKYETHVGERGVKLSGGERQRVAIARAILSNAKILILDEATSSLDSESERLIQNALKNLMKNKTTLVIAHRLSTIVQMDRILVLKSGRVIEEGSHSDLVARHEGLYKKLWELQSKGYL